MQQSKRSIYYQKSKSLFKDISTSVDIGDLDKPEDATSVDKVYLDKPVSPEVNPLFSREFALYLLNNWCGLLPLWSDLHLGDQGRHGRSEIYRMWSDKFADRDCVQNPPRTQGIVEFHHKSLKHITMNSKRERIDSVVGNLLISKKSKSRQVEIVKTRQKRKTNSKTEKIKDNLPKKLVTEKWSKKKKNFHLVPVFFKVVKVLNLTLNPPRLLVP